MNESKIQSTCESSLEMKRMSSTILALETSEREKEEQIRVFRKTIHDYELLINDLQSKFEIAEEDQKEENKFDMLRIQAKEISEKGREIDRLNGLLNHLKNKDKKIDDKKIDDKKIDDKQIEEKKIDDKQIEEKKIDDKKIDDKQIEEKKIETVLTLVEESIKNPIEITDPETGEQNPNFIYSGSVESEPSPGGSIPSEHSEDDVLDRGKLLKVTAKGIKYFVYENENPQQLYEFNEDKLCEKIVGSRTKNERGKYKVQLFAS